MAETVSLTQDKLEVVRGLTKDSIITCTHTSDPSVYVNAITIKDTITLRQGDSTAEARLTSLRLHLFRMSGSGPYAATINITDVT